MAWDKLHAEEARAMDLDKSAVELAGIAPPCQDCGRKEAISGSEYCADCQPE